MRRPDRCAAAVAVLLGALAAGCADARTRPGAGWPTWTEQCASQVSYWVHAALAQRRDPGWDYQHMALTADVYDVQRAVQRAALAVQRRDGTAAAERVVEADASARCAAAARTRGSSPGPGGGWPQ